MLYDGALRFSRDARSAIVNGGVRQRRDAISRALAIVSELQCTLDMEAGGELSRRLDGLYAFVLDRLIEASSGRSVEPIDEAIRVLASLQEAWSAVARTEPSAMAAHDRA